MSDLPPKTILEIDPDADTVISLTPATGPFAKWPHTTTPTQPAPAASSTSIFDAWEFAQATRGPAAFGTNPSQTTPQPAFPTSSGPSLIQPSGTQNPCNTKLFSTNPQSTLGFKKFAPIDWNVHWSVSSRHLRLASPVFRNMMSSQWQEGEKHSSDGRFHITATEWYTTEFEIFLHILHGCHSKVPDVILLEQMAKLAVLVSYYQAHEAMGLYPRHWLRTVERMFPIPSGYCRDVVLWIFVAKVFGFSDEYQRAKDVVVWHATMPLDTLELPISQPTVGEYAMGHLCAQCEGR